MPRLTDRTIEALRPKANRYEVWDDARPGFGVRVSPRGVKSFVWVYHYQGRPRRMTFGTFGRQHPHLSLADVGVKLAEAKRVLESGSDPGAKLVAARVAERHAETIDELVEDYLARYARARKRSAAEDERMLKKDVTPRWGRRKVKDISRRDVVVLLNEIVDRGAPISANRTLGILRRMFNYAIGQAIIETSPCDRVEAPAPENRRDRVLTDDQIAQLWRTLDGAAPMQHNLRCALRFMLATGQRRSEVLGLHASEIDRSKRLWTLAASRSKNGREHLIPLSALALAILDEVEPVLVRSAEGGEPKPSEYPFASRVTGEPYKGQSIGHAVQHLFGARRKAQNRKAPKGIPPPPLKGIMEPFTPHDLRRSAATRMRELGISRADVKMVLNHVETDVTSRYDKYDGLDEKRRALELWGKRLQQIVSGGAPFENVMELVRA